MLISKDDYFINRFIILDYQKYSTLFFECFTMIKYNCFRKILIKYYNYFDYLMNFKPNFILHL